MSAINSNAVAFLFAYVRKMPKTMNELNQLKELRAQSALLLRFAKARGLETPVRRLAVTTYRSAVFTRNADFRRAVAEARTASAVIWVADLGQLFRMATALNTIKIMEDLDKLDLDLVDCTSGKKWTEFSAPERLMLMQEAASRKISSAVSMSTRKGQAPELQSARKGALSNKAKADQHATQLRPVIEELKATLEPGESLTPAKLMRHLNEQGIQPARGSKWSYNGCKNLLHRLQLHIH